MTTITAPALPDACRAYGQRAARLAEHFCEPTNWPAGYTDADVRRTAAARAIWNAPAAAEYVRPVLQDGLDLAALMPEQADDVWHHVAGAIILPGTPTGEGCNCDCATPAGHRDALIDLAKSVRPVETTGA